MKQARFQINGFRSRLTLQWLVVFGVILFLALAGVYFGLRFSLMRSLEASLRTLAATEVAAGTDANRGVHLHAFNDPAVINETHIKKFVQILSKEGQVINQSEELKSRDPLVLMDVVMTVLDGQAVLSDVMLDGFRGRSFSLKAEKDGEQYIFVVAVPLSHIEATLAATRLVLFLAGLVALAATAIVGYRLSTLALRPVDMMTRRARAIGQDNLRARLDEPDTDDEMGRLARVLNGMLDRLYFMIESHQRFAADASHELRSPLTALRGQLEVALRRARTAEEYRAVLASCLEEVAMLSRLSENLLELARSDARRLDLDMSEVEIQPLVDAEIAHFKLEAQMRKVELKAEVPEGIAVIADAGRLSRVLANLLGNAIHYSKLGGGRVTVAAGNAQGEVWIEVRDEGIGLDDQQKRQVFDRFWRGDKARSIRAGGAGLGLSICREITNAHGGQITVSSAPGRGSCFRVCFPARVEY